MNIENSSMCFSTLKKTCIIKIKISNITIQVIYQVIFNEFLDQNKFAIEKHIKFIIENDTHIKFIEQY
jgi:uncharacterized protein YlaN (UPF0358 family)